MPDQSAILPGPWVVCYSLMTGKRTHAHRVTRSTATGPPWDIATTWSRVFSVASYEVLGMTPPLDACGNCLAELVRRTAA